MTNQALTADTITDKQIKALRTEAGWAGDDAQVKLCDMALTYDDNYEDWLHTRESHKRAAAWEDVQRAYRAKHKCAQAINAARNMEDA